MSEVEEPRESFGQTLRWLGHLAFVAVAGVFYVSAFRDQPRALYAFLCLGAGQFVACLVHECGHAVAALACRWRIVLFVVRPIGIQIPNGNLAIVPRHYSDGAGGWVATVPLKADADTKVSWAIILMAGPLASFLLAALMLGGSISVVTPIESGPFIEAHLCFGLAVQALQGCFFSLLPSGDGRNPTDGDQLKALIRSDDFETLRPVSWIEILLGSNVRLRDIPDWMVFEARRSGERAEWIERYVATTEIGRVLDNPPFDVGRARSMIDAYRERYGASDWLASCDAWLAAVWEGDLERARTALAEVQMPSEVPALSFAVLAALAARDGDAALTHSRLELMRASLRAKSPFRDLTFLDIGSLIEAVLASAKSTQAGSAPGSR